MASEQEKLRRIDVRKKLEVQGVLVPYPERPENEFPELSEEAEDLCSRVWRRGDEGEVFAKGGEAPLTRKDLITLSGLNWLNDEVC